MVPSRHHGHLSIAEETGSVRQAHSARSESPGSNLGGLIPKTLLFPLHNVVSEYIPPPGHGTGI